MVMYIPLEWTAYDYREPFPKVRISFRGQARAFISSLEPVDGQPLLYATVENLPEVWEKALEKIEEVADRVIAEKGL